ncbi:hypothetical protein Sru01_53860 [Sphaerisporangium rufum]|uniref:histidine kinase n=1 Tax=Sphaerisporangium rufum TaxID=1381558 RepID=A0A919R6I0_9ACTN|nr:histidine kinase [Sphaerisporangium rufum]GII80404.1 hypothetical protein Sru01_53860 [Sphaerisporangium rufum]
MLLRTSKGFGRSLVLVTLALADALLCALAAVVMVLSFGLGMVFLFPATIRLVRRRTALARRIARSWSGVDIADPYRPPPPPPVPQADGWYREGRSLYRTSLVPSFNRALDWMLKDPATWRDLAWVFGQPILGAAVTAVPVIMVAGSVAGLVATGRPLETAAGVLLAVAGLFLAPHTVRLHGRWTELLLAPTEKARLTNELRRVDQARTIIVDVQAAELRRIERDLHDGAQARLVAIGMTLGAAEELVETDPQAARALIAKARDASATSLIELRRMVRGIHPPVLAERGLGDAVRALALDSPLAVTVSVDLPGRSAAPVESAAYFVVSELLTNASRHSGAASVTIDISHRGPALRITVTDDGQGGADPARGSGLRGIERRLAAFDGVLALHSPRGGPTTATVELPHAFQGHAARRAVPAGWRTKLMGVCFGLCWLPLFPQGLVPIVLKIAGVDERSWFLALYLPEPWQWPTLLGMIALGAGMLAFAVAEQSRWKASESNA